MKTVNQCWITKLPNSKRPLSTINEITSLPSPIQPVTSRLLMRYKSSENSSNISWTVFTDLISDWYREERLKVKVHLAVLGCTCDQCKLIFQAFLWASCEKVSVLIRNMCTFLHFYNVSVGKKVLWLQQPASRSGQVQHQGQVWMVQQLTYNAQCFC